MSLPVLNLIRGWPTDARELARVLFALNRGVRENGTRSFAVDQSFLHPLYTANRNSVQNIDNVLTAASGPSTSTVIIASHSVKFDDRTVAYSSGTVAGLSTEVLYYIYATDPERAGGAVTYLATTNPDNLIAQGIYYVGFVKTPIAGNTFAITAATSANPGRFTTASAHGWTTNQSVLFAALPGDFGTNLNGNTYVITVIDADEFTIPVNTTAYAAYTSGGTATRVTTSVVTGGGAGGGVGGKRFDYLGTP